jgi:hypothetical protein
MPEPTPLSRWSTVGDFVRIRQHFYKVIEIDSTGNLLRQALLVRGRKLYTALQGPCGDFSRPARIEGWVV